MKIMVCVKRVVDFNARIRIKPDNSGIETGQVKMSMNPFDEIAVEEAVRLKEAGKASEVIAVSCGVEKNQDTLRTALAMGADRAILIHVDEQIDSLSIASLLKAVVLREAVGLAILGKQATDDDAGQTGQMLAGLLDWSQARAVSQVSLEDEAVYATEENDRGSVELRLNLPAVLTADLRLNAPRYVTLPNMAKARKQVIESLSPADLGVTVSNSLAVIRVDEPPGRQGTQIVPDVATLVDKLKNDAKVI